MVVVIYGIMTDTCIYIQDTETSGIKPSSFIRPPSSLSKMGRSDGFAVRQENAMMNRRTFAGMLAGTTAASILACAGMKNETRN